jgi:hypothetical protein
MKSALKKVRTKIPFGEGIENFWENNSLGSSFSCGLFVQFFFRSENQHNILYILIP